MLAESLSLFYHPSILIKHNTSLIKINQRFIILYGSEQKRMKGSAIKGLFDDGLLLFELRDE